MSSSHKIPAINLYFYKVPIRSIVLFLLLVCKLHAQNNVFRNYSVNTGLSSSEVYSVIQDSKGYMWFCSDAGVCRYDGYSFRTFTSEQGLADNTIFTMYEDRTGRIWFSGMSKKISYYDPAADSIISIACNDRLSLLGKGSTVTSLYVDEKDTLFVALSSGKLIYKISPENNYNTLKPVPVKTEGWQVWFFDPRHFLWSFTSTDTQPNPLSITTYSHTHKINYHTYSLHNFGGDRIRRVTVARDGIIFTQDGFMYYQKKDTLLSFSFPFPIISLYRDKEENIWCGTKENGVFEYKNGDFSKPAEHYFNTLSISAIFEDAEGGYWFSTLEHGVYYTPSLLFQYYDKELSGLSDTKIFSVTAHGDSVICFTRGGFMNSIRGNRVSVNTSIRGFYAYETDPKGDVLLVSQDSSFFYNLKTRKKVFLRAGDPNDLLYTRKVYVKPDKKIYAVYSAGICSIDDKGSAKISIENKARITSLYVTGDTIWFGMPNGLFCYANGQTDTLGNRFPILKNRVDDIVRDKNLNFWFATKGAGVLIKKGTRIIQITVKNGLASNLCKSILLDSFNVAWVGTNRGISKITAVNGTYKIENYSSTDGLLCDDITQLAVSGNYIYAATSRGVIKFDKTKLSFSHVQPPIYISRFYVNESEQKKQTDYLLAHDENFIRINFIGLSYKLPGAVTYKYKLTGLDTSWKYTQNTNVQFTTLPPGSYSFIVYALNKDHIESKVPAVVSFFIATPYWKTWWFFVIVTSLISGLIYILFKTRVSFIKRTEGEKTKLNKKIAEVELKAIRAQMNPHFIFNAINSIQHYILANDSDLAYRYLSKFSQLIRNVLENSKHEFIPLKKEIETIELYIGIEKLRFDTKFDHTVYVDPTLDEMNLSISPLLIQPYVENAIWHGLMHKKAAGKLNVFFLNEGELIRCIIEDDGIGREKAMLIQSNNLKKHKSMALSLNNELLEIIGNSYNNKLNMMIYDIKTDAGLPCGTRVEVLIPKIKHNGL